MNDDDIDDFFSLASAAENVEAEQHMSAGSSSGTGWRDRRLLGRDDLIFLPLLVFWRWFAAQVELVEVIVIREGVCSDEEEVKVAPPSPRGLRRLLLFGSVPMLCCFYFYTANSVNG